MRPRCDGLRRGRRSRCFAVAGIVALALLAAAGIGACGGDDESASKVVEYVVPEGTWGRLLYGEEVTVMPTLVELHVGDTIRIRNEDTVPQYVGPYYVKANSEFELTYGSPGVFAGSCTLSESGRYEIIVRE